MLGKIYQACVLELALRTVNLQLSQRPAASNFLIDVSNSLLHDSIVLNCFTFKRSTWRA